MHRMGTMKLPDGNNIMGVEASGVIEKLGSGVDGISIGDRVVYEYFGGGKCFSNILLIQI